MIKVVTAVINNDQVIEVITDVLQNQPRMKDFQNFWEAVSEHSDEVSLFVQTDLHRFQAENLLKEYGCLPESENLFVIGRKLLDDKKYTEAVKSIYDGVEFWHVEKDSKSDWNHVLYCVQSDKFLGMVLNVCTHNILSSLQYHSNDKPTEEEWSNVASGMKLSEYLDLVVLNVTEQCQIELDMSGVPSDNLSSVLTKILETVLTFESS